MEAIEGFVNKYGCVRFESIKENALTHQYNDLLKQCNTHNDAIKHKKSSKKGKKQRIANAICMLVKMKDIAEQKELEWYSERKQLFEQVQSVTENILAMVAKADANVADHIQQLVTEKCVLKQRLDELEKTCMLKEQCIASLNQTEAENLHVITLLREELQGAQAAIMELSSKHAIAECAMVEVPSAHAQCSAKIEVKHAQKTDALIAASDVAMTEINGGDVNKSAITVLESD